MVVLRAVLVAFSLVGIRAAQAQPAATDSANVRAANDLLQRAFQVETIATQAPNDQRVQAIAAAAARDFRARAQLLMQADQNQIMRDELARRQVQ
jgi:hypothetical protein